MPDALLDTGNIVINIVIFKNLCPGVATLAQWVKNLTTAALVPAEAQVQSLIQHSGLRI